MNITEVFFFLVSKIRIIVGGWFFVIPVHVRVVRFVRASKWTVAIRIGETVSRIEVLKRSGEIN